MYYIVVLQTEQHFYRARIEGGKKYIIGQDKKSLFTVPALGNGSLEIQMLEDQGALTLKGKKIKLELYSVPRAHERKTISNNPWIAVRWSRDTGLYPRYYQLPSDCRIHIGRSPMSDIVLNENFVSRYHLVITSKKGRTLVEDVGSRNGTFLNGMPVRRAMMKSGDVLDILELRIRFANNRLYFENLHHHPEIKTPTAGRSAKTKSVLFTEEIGDSAYHQPPQMETAHCNQQTDNEDGIFLDEEVESKTMAWRKGLPRHTRVLPDFISIQKMADISSSMGKIAVGYETEFLSPALFSPEDATSFTIMGKVGCGKTSMLDMIARIIKTARPDSLIFCVDTQKCGLAGLETIGAKYTLLTDFEVVDAFVQVILSSLNDRARTKEKNPGASVDVPLILLVIDDIIQFSALPEDLRINLHQILQYGKGLGVLVLCGLRLGDMHNFYAQSQIGLDLMSADLALALSDSPVHYEGYYPNTMTQKQRYEVLSPGFGLFYRDSECAKIKCVNRK